MNNPYLNCLQKKAFVESIVKKAANLICKEIIKKTEKSCDVTWPQTIESLNDSSRKPPDIVELFFRHLLAGESHHVPSQKRKEL